MGKGAKRTIVLEIVDDKESIDLDELNEHIMLMEVVRSHLDVEWAESIGAFDARAGHRVFGFTSTLAYLKDYCRMSGARAKTSIAMARAARRFKATFLSWKHRQLSTDQAQLLFQAFERMPDKFPDAEHVLLEIVGDSYDETRKVLEYWRQTVDKPGIPADEKAQLERRVSI